MGNFHIPNLLPGSSQMNDCKTTFLFAHKQNLQGSQELSSQ